MGARSDIESVFLVGSGPIVIGQACEFDYSGTQACRALKEEGYRVILLNSNPATIMTDPAFSCRTFIEPMTPEVVEKIIEAERPSALLPTVGGQTALNLAVEVAGRGVLDSYGVELIGAGVDAIERAEDRELFREAMARIGLDVPRSVYVGSVEEAKGELELFDLPLIVRPSFTLGGGGAGVAFSTEQLERIVEWGLSRSPVGRVLIEESVMGWKEYELEVMRDRKDNVVIVCSIENLDPMGIHTGDSITVAPAQTLSDREYQAMRDAAIAVMREIGVDTGGANIQFAVDPKSGRMVVIEMNPRVSRSSALASKATGFPIARMATKLAVGYTLDEIPNTITKKTPACFEPTLDYVVVKAPRFAFEKFPGTLPKLTTQMKSVGEAMAIGRTFKEALQKAIVSLEIDRTGIGGRGSALSPVSGGRSLLRPPGRVRRQEEEEKARELEELLSKPSPERLFHVVEALERGIGVDRVAALSGIDPWFVDQMAGIVALEGGIASRRRAGGATGSAGSPGEGRAEATRSPDGGSLPTGKEESPPEELFLWKRAGMSDARIGELIGVSEDGIRAARMAWGIGAVFKRVDTCAAEFEALTPYLYSTYEAECEARPTSKRKIVILGGGPNRIGQGIEFDYCCVHAAQALSEAGFETIMVNCNPETVSTDYDTSDRLYFEPLTFEHVMNVVDVERPWGVVVQLGGQTPLKLAGRLEGAGVPILGTPPDAIDRAEDRERFREVIFKLKLLQPESGLARSLVEAIQVARHIGFPLLLRPSYVLGGSAMEVVCDEKELKAYVERAARVSPDHPILIDRFLEGATEVDVDAVSDGSDVLIGGVMEHIEQAGIHSGDSAMCLPPRTLGKGTISRIIEQTRSLAKELGVRGPINVQFAVKGETVYVLEANPRASRTVPFVSKAAGVPLAKIAALVMAGARLNELGVAHSTTSSHVAVKCSVFPFDKFPGADAVLGPEMRSTGEVMGIDEDFGPAYAKALLASGAKLPQEGEAFLSVCDRDKPQVAELASSLKRLGFDLCATKGTRTALAECGIDAMLLARVSEGSPNVIDHLEEGRIALVVNTPSGRRTFGDSFLIRRKAIERGIPLFTSIHAALAAVRSMESLRRSEPAVLSLQDYHRRSRPGFEQEKGRARVEERSSGPAPV